jgi:putative ABC transport system permease protein
MKASPATLAWMNLTSEPRRFAVSLAGVSFAVLLMFVEVGFWHALLDGQVQLINSLDAELFLVSTARTNLTDGEGFPLTRLQQARSVPGVAFAQPIYIYPMLWKNRAALPESKDPIHWPIRVVGFHPEARYPPFRADRMPEFIRDRERLLETDVVFMDRQSKRSFDVIRRGLLTADPSPSLEREIGGRMMRIVGTFGLGTDFSFDGTLALSARNLERLVGAAGGTVLDRVQVGLIKLSPGADENAVRDAVARALPEEDVVVLTRRALIAEEQAYWRKSTPVGFIFFLGMIVGFIVGAVICYQILSTDVADHLAEYATLKAIGYPDAFLTRVVLWQAILLAGLGFTLGAALAAVLYAGLHWFTGLPLVLMPLRGATVLGLTVLMCMISGFLALRRVRTADPAEVFG